MMGAMLNKLSGGAIERLFILIIIAGSGLTGFAMYKGCDLDVSLSSGIKISGCTGVMVALNTDGGNSEISSEGTMVAALSDKKDVARAGKPVSPGAVPEQVATEIAALMSEPAPVVAPMAAPAAPAYMAPSVVLEPLDKVMAEGEKARAKALEPIKQQQVTNMVAARNVKKAMYAMQAVMSPVFFVTAESLAECIPSIDAKTAGAAMLIGTQSNAVCGCGSQPGLYRATARPPEDTFNADIHTCLQSKSVVCIEHNCPTAD